MYKDRYKVIIINDNIVHYSVVKPNHINFDLSVKINKNSINKDNMLCVICYENESNLQTSCYHNYCSKCLIKWLDIKDTCPYCRNTIYNVYKII